MKCKPNCAPGGTLSKTRLASCSGGILAGSNWRILASRSGLILGRIHRQRILSRILGGIHWRLLWWDDRRGCSGGILGGLHRRGTLAGYSAGSTGAALAGYWAGSTGEQLWRDTGRDPLASSSGGILGGIHWRAALAGYSEGSTDELL